MKRGGVLSVFAAASIAAAVPAPSFSFKYGDRPVSGETSMQVDQRLKVTVDSAAYLKVRRGGVGAVVRAEARV